LAVMVATYRGRRREYCKWVGGWKRVRGCVFCTGFVFFTWGTIDGAVVLISWISYVGYFT